MACVEDRGLGLSSVGRVRVEARRQVRGVVDGFGRACRVM